MLLSLVMCGLGLRVSGGRVERGALCPGKRVSCRLCRVLQRRWYAGLVYREGFYVWELSVSSSRSQVFLRFLSPTLHFCAPDGRH